MKAVESLSLGAPLHEAASTFLRSLAQAPTRNKDMRVPIVSLAVAKFFNRRYRPAGNSLIRLVRSIAS